MEFQDLSNVRMDLPYVKRALAGPIARATAPMVVVQGAHEVGKTSLIQNEVSFSAFHYVTLADDSTRAHAAANPREWVASLPRPVVIDDAHCVEGIAEAVAAAAAQEQGGRPVFVLVSCRQVSEDEAPASVCQGFTLFPLTQAELRERPGCVVDDLFNATVSRAFQGKGTRSDIRIRMRTGGFPGRALCPTRALSRKEGSARPFQDELRMLDEESVGAQASPEQLIERDVLKAVLTNPGMALGVTPLAEACRIDTATLTSHLARLQERFLIHKLSMLDTPPARQHSFSKTRVHPMDVSVACEALLKAGYDTALDPKAFSKALKTLCVHQLVAAAAWAAEPTTCWHWRKFNRRMREVDLVLAREGRLVGVSVRNSLAASSDSIGALRILAEDKRFARGFIIYMGKFARRLTENVWALPVSALWEKSAFHGHGEADDLYGLQCPQGT